MLNPTKLALAALTLTFLAGCGATATAPTVRAAGVATAQTDAGLKKSFPRIHKAIFTTLDADKNGWLDEVEAGTHMSSADFQKADKAQGWGSAHKLSRAEFVEWATSTFLWFNDTPEQWAARFRKELGKTFKRLDENRDGQLARLEISGRDLAKLKLTFAYDKLRVTVPIVKVPAELFASADKNADTKLSQAEFEDLYVEAVIQALGGEGTDTPPAPPADAPADTPVAQ